MNPAGELMFNVLASFAQFERSLIAERVRPGMARAKKSGVHVGRPSKLNGDLEALRPLIESGRLSCHQAARQLGSRTPRSPAVSSALVQKSPQKAPRKALPSKA
jgi:DNA invertase Pin-like site-specific DNA recombinase